MDDFDTLWHAVNQLPSVEGIMPTDVLEVPNVLGAMLRKLIRSGSMSLDRLAAELHLSPELARHIGDVLIEKGYLTLDTTEPWDSGLYRPRLAQMRKRNIPFDL